MLLDLHQARVAVAALQALERPLADELEDLVEAGRAPLANNVRSALDRNERIATLTKKLATAGERRIDRLETELIVAALERYLALLQEPAGTHGRSDDFLLDSDPSARQAERQRAADLFKELSGHAPDVRYGEPYQLGS